MLLNFVPLFLSIRAFAKASPYSERKSSTLESSGWSSPFGVVAHDELVIAPRIGDVLRHLHTSGSGLNWIDVPETNSSYVLHTFEEWAAAEHAVMGYKANTFAYAASQIVNGNMSRERSLQDGLEDPHLSPRLDGGHSVEPGVETDTPDGRHMNGVNRFFCYNSGQFATNVVWTQMLTLGCGAFVTHWGNHIATWRSQRWPTPAPDSKLYAMFYQYSGWWTDKESNAACGTLLNEIRKWYCKYNADGMGHGRKRDVSDAGYYQSQGGILRGYDSPVGTPNNKLGKMIWEVRADPNTCHSNGNPC
ncbi:MAG: hypothetical protein Q9227_008379 [Pyrenula ochraceoflavens]